MFLSRPILADQDAIVASSGDNQTMIGYVGDSQLYSVTSAVPNSYNTTQQNQTQTTTPPSEGAISPPGQIQPQQIFCNSNTDCTQPGVGLCWNHQCYVNLFDVVIVSFESPVKLGSFFNFTYLIKDMANVNSDVNVNFWIAQDNTNVSSGSDQVYIGGLQQITKQGELFLPSNISSGTYTFYVQVSNPAEIAHAYRTIQIVVNATNGTATITPIPQTNQNFITLSEGELIIIIATVLLLLIIILLILYLKERARINGLERVIQRTYGPYYRAKLKLKILKSRRRANRERRIRQAHLRRLKHHLKKKKR